MTEISLPEAHEGMEYEEVEIYSGFSLPSSTPATFHYRDDFPYTDAEKVADLLKGDSYNFVGTATEQHDGDVFVSSKVYDWESDACFNVRLYSGLLCVFPNPEIPFSAFKRFVTHVNDSLGVELVPIDNH